MKPSARPYRHPIISKETIRKVKALLESGELSGYRGTRDEGGKYVTLLEQEFQRYFSVNHAIALNSASSGLYLALRALEIGSGRVATSPLTFSASASCILLNNLEPVFVDVEEDYFNINPQLVPDSVDAVVAVHLQGHPCDMDSLLGFGIPVIEDVAQAIGAKYKGRYTGTLGKCGIFSFNQSKQISTGEGGMLITNDSDFAEKIRWMSNHGECRGGLVGFNMRMTEINALIALEQFKKLRFNLEWRTSLAHHLTNQLKNVKYITTPKTHPQCVHSWYTYTLKSPYRDDIQKALSTSFFFGNGGGYALLHHLPAYPNASNLPVAEKLTQVMMFTDILRYPMTRNEVDELAYLIKEFMDGRTD